MSVSAVDLARTLADQFQQSIRQDLKVLGPETRQVIEWVLEDVARYSAARVLGKLDLAREEHIKAQLANLDAAQSAVVGRAVNDVLLSGAKFIVDLLVRR